MITIELPWPDKVLNPNSNANWRKKIEPKKQARRDGFWAAYEAMQGSTWLTWKSEKISSQYIFHPPDRRRRDMDNFVASMKSYQDGVCEMLGVDDSILEMEKPEWGEVVKGGKVVLTLEEME
jgi:crossover junction endodeoxyribonuclease RusA